MQTLRTGSSSPFGSRLTWLGSRMLIMYGAVYVLELLCEHWLKIPVAGRLQLYPMGDPRLGAWQFATHAFIHDPAAPFSFIISCIVFCFFSAPVESVLGRVRFLQLFYGAAAGGALCGFLMSGVGGFNAPFLGMSASLLAMVVVFGLLNPEATILLMFVLPLKAKYLSYGTTIITALTFMAKANPHGAYHLGGILVGWLFLKGYGRLVDPGYLHLQFLQWQLKRKRSKFKVIDGFKNDNDEQKGSPPTYH